MEFRKTKQTKVEGIFSQYERGVLLMAAREAIRSAFYGTPAPSVNYGMYPGLKAPLGAFVTLTLNGDLRGCIGYIYSDEPVFSTVCEVAKLAASEDPRFPPLSEQELSQVLIEVSVLSEPQKLESYQDIVIGKHGLILEEENAQALLLPQVAIEHNMGVEQFLSALCNKAGLNHAAWAQKFLNISIFTAEVFGEQPHRSLTGERF